MSYRVQTQSFTGPFDLLLQLVTRQRVDIGAISISEVAEQYLAELDRMGDMDLDVASDFVLVAATLLDIKAASLIPEDVRDRARNKRDFEDDEDDDLANLSPDEAREVLIARLIAYKQFRNAGAALGARMEQTAREHPRTAGPDPEFLGLMPDYLEGITLRGLAVMCADLAARRESFLLESEHIAAKRVPVALTVASVDRVCRIKEHVSFSELLDGQSSPEQVVVTFLAVLELSKLGMVTLEQAENFAEIFIQHVEGAEPFELSRSDMDYGSETFEDAPAAIRAAHATQDATASSEPVATGA